MSTESREYFLNQLESLYCKSSLSPDVYINNTIQHIINNSLLSETSALLDIPKPYLEKDFLGRLYQNITSKSDKRIKGQFFTEPEIVSYIVNRALKGIAVSSAEELSKIRICDPACGSGMFLIETYHLLHELYKSAGLSEEEIPRTILTKNLHGFDRDSVSVAIARYNLSLISNIPCDEIKTIAVNDFLYKDALSFSQNNIGESRFNILIGNPPWGSRLSSHEKKYFRQAYFSAKSGINTFTLFIERSLELAVEGGTIAFLVPESLLNIEAHKNCRNLLITQTRITEIKLWGDQFKDVYAPCITVITKKSENTPVADNIAKFVLKNSVASIQQLNFFSTHNNIININYTSKERDLLEQIKTSDHTFLKNNADFFLGIVTGSNQKFLTKQRDENAPDPIIVGKDVSRYSINYSGHYFKYNPEQLQQVAPIKYYEARNKVLYKFIGKRLCFAIDREGYFTLNNVNGFIPKFEWIHAEALIAILNSTLMQYYYDKNFFTVKVLRGNLEKLPIRRISKEANNLLRDLALQAMEADSLVNQKRAMDTIDDVVFSEYDIEDKQAYHIYESYSEKQQLILPGV